MNAAPTTRAARDRARAAGRAWARSLQLADIGVLMDAWILGTFDWRDWFEDKPAPGFLSGAYEEARTREECEG